MKKTYRSLGLSILITGLFLAGCSKSVSEPPIESGNNNKALSISNDPVTIKVFFDSVVEDALLTNLQEHLKKKHPNITLELVKASTTTTLDSVITSGQTPDIIYTYNGKIGLYTEKDLLYDMNPLIKSHNFDLSRFEPNYVEDVKVVATAAKGELYGIPVSTAYHALYYNKEIFDRFGLPYPTDGMTWDQVRELAKKVTRNDGGVQYRGYDIGNFVWAAQPLGIQAIDYTTDKATVNTDQWKKVFQLMHSYFSIPGNESASPKPSFLKNRTVAMLSEVAILGELETAAQDGLNWDVVQSPSYPEKPNTFGNASVNVLMVTKSSTVKDQAMQVISVATSDEVQMALSKTAMVSPLKNPEIKKAFGMDREGLKNKNILGIFKSKPVKYPMASTYRSPAEGIVRQQIADYLKNNTDVNTALAKTEEAINQYVATQKGGK